MGLREPVGHGLQLGVEEKLRVDELGEGRLDVEWEELALVVELWGNCLMDSLETTLVAGGRCREGWVLNFLSVCIAVAVGSRVRCGPD